MGFRYHSGSLTRTGTAKYGPYWSVYRRPYGVKTLELRCSADPDLAGSLPISNSFLRIRILRIARGFSCAIDSDPTQLVYGLSCAVMRVLKQVTTSLYPSQGFVQDRRE